MGLKDKASRIDFGSLPGLSASPALLAPAGENKPPKTAPGAMMAFAVDQRSEIVQENDLLRKKAGRVDELQGQLGEALQDLQQWQDAKATRLIDPERIVRSRFANRHAVNFDGVEFEQLKAEIRDAGGNVQAIKVRTVVGLSGEARYELVFGHRRHEACRQLGLPVLAVVDNLDDRTLFVEMDRENRSRKDLSAWEQGAMYRRALKEGLFPSNRKLAEATGVDLGAVGKALALADLPDEVVAAFGSPLELQYRWAKPLSDALMADHEGMLGRARELKKQAGTLVARTVFERLTSRTVKGVEPFNPPPQVDVMIGDKCVARLQITAAGGANVAIVPGAMPATQLQALADLVEGFLTGSEKRN